MQISVVIPTYNRKVRLLSLLGNLNNAAFPVYEVIIVDAGKEKLTPGDYAQFSNLTIHYLDSEPSVCIQRNTGIKAACSSWIFICDDDIEVPADYLSKLAAHIEMHPEAGAVSGVVLQQEQGKWVGKYDIVSAKELLAKYIFGLSIWGDISCIKNNVITRKIKSYYARRGNHLSKAGWPVITNFSRDFFATPVYGLGASLIKKEWLEMSPYDEVLDRHGIGDNYGVAVGFPATGIQVVSDAFVYHHQEPAGRLQKPLQYYRRVWALHYFIKIKKCPAHVKTGWLLWSLFGNVLLFALAGNSLMAKAAGKTFFKVFTGNNPYYRGRHENKKIIEPLL
ncbi:MAG TPA: glycosyltransferase family 2 protein [Chitinophagaceae bacterium]|nr:glycosyltransferase family 2 protein [Chitinophagaceae bacterium]